MKLKQIAVAVMAVGLVAGAHAATLSEGFNDISTLTAAGWVMTNLSTTPSQPWFQGNAGVFSAQSGPSSSYIAANFLSSGSDTGTIDNWLISPLLTATGGSTLSFYTRTADAGYADFLEVKFSAGSSTDTASFTSLLTTVGGTSYPTGWTLFSVNLPTAATGRIAFHYSVASAANADYIGIDNVNVVAVPEPATLAMFGIGLGALAVARRRRSA